MACSECRGVGYLLNDHHAGQGWRDLSLDLVACIMPDCEARDIATLGIKDVNYCPGLGVLSLSGFTGPVYR